MTGEMTLTWDRKRPDQLFAAVLLMLFGSLLIPSESPADTLNFEEAKADVVYRGPQDVSGGVIPIDVYVTPKKPPVSLTFVVRSSYSTHGWNTRNTTRRTVAFQNDRKTHVTLYCPIPRDVRSIRVNVRTPRGNSMMTSIRLKSRGADQRIQLLHTGRTKDVSEGGYAVSNQRLSVTYLKPEHLWRHWKGYVSVDGVLMSGDTLRGLSTAHRQSIYRWVASGGNLILYNVDYQRLREGDSLPDVYPSVSFGSAKQEENGYLHANHVLGSMFVLSDRSSRSLAGNESALRNALRRDSVNNPLPFLTESRFQWHKRYGYSGPEEDDRAILPDDLQIAELVHIPVTSGLIMLFFFAVLIGPVNYWYLKKKDRMSYMLLTIPLLALLTTGFVFAWDILKHGLGNDIRARGILRVDQKQRQAALVNRYMLYMAIAPGQLSFPEDTYATYLQRKRTLRQGNHRFITYDRRRTNTYMSGTATRSRVPHYLDTRSVYPFRNRLVVKRNSPHELSVTNGLGVPVYHLLLLDRSRRVYAAADRKDRRIAPGETVRFEQLETTVGRGRLYSYWRSTFNRDGDSNMIEQIYPECFRSMSASAGASRFIGLSDQMKSGRFGVSSYEEHGSRYLIQGLHWASDAREKSDD